MMNLIPSINLAYTVGVYLGDGCAVFSTKYKNSYFVLNAIDRDFVERTARCLSDILNKQIVVFEDKWHRKSGRKPLYKTVAYSKVFASWLVQKCHGKKRIPKFIKEGNLDIKRAFVAGIMDSKGTVYTPVSTKQTLMSVYTSEPWLKPFCKILTSLGVVLLTRTSSTGNGSTKPVFRQNLRVRSFVESGCYFTIKRKQTKLTEYRHSILRDYTPSTSKFPGEDIVRP